MPRPISWQSQLSEIHRRVQDSPRSLYGREDIQRLFGVQERVAQRLLELMPRHRQANSVVVEREHLIQFLADAIHASKSNLLREHLDGLKKDPPKPSRRKLRLSLPRALEDGNLASIDRWNIELRRGKITLHFTTLEDLAGKLVQLSKVIDAPEFERRFCEEPVAIAASAEQGRLRDESNMIRAHNRFFVKTAAAAEAARRPEILQAVVEALLVEAGEALEEYRRLALQLGLEPEDLEALALKIPKFPSESAKVPSDSSVRTGT